MANYVSHIEQLRVATESIWTATPETKLGKVPVVKALVRGFRGTSSTVVSSDESDVSFRVEEAPHQSFTRFSDFRTSETAHRETAASISRLER